MFEMLGGMPGGNDILTGGYFSAIGGGAGCFVSNFGWSSGFFG
jgi:hypothetical protein